MEKEKLLILTELEEKKMKILNISDLLAQRRRECDKLAIIIKILYKSYESIKSKSIEYMIDSLNTLSVKANTLEAKRHKDINLEKLILLSSSSSSSASLIDKIKLKDYELRNKDERQFLGMDIILHPSDYLYLTSVEAEQMSFDHDYQCHLSKTDLQRILKLPEQINLALPFLNTIEEITAHRLLTKYYKKKDETYFQQFDFLTYDRLYNNTFTLKEGLTSSSAAAIGKGTGGSLSIDQPSGSGERGGGAGGKPLTAASEDTFSLLTGGDDAYSTSLQADLFNIVSMKHIQEAEIIHDILLRESLRDRLRSSYQDEVLTDEEKQFIVIDKLLFPHIYGLDEGINNTTKTVVKRTLQERREQREKENNFDFLNSTEKSYQQNMMTRSIESLNNVIAKNAEIPGKIPLFSKRFHDERKGIKADTSKEGDLYEVLREHFDSFTQLSNPENTNNNGKDDLFNYYWICPFNREELLKISQTSLHQLTENTEATYIKKLLLKYHVSDEESILGNARCQLVNEITGKMIKLMKKLNRKSKKEIALNHSSYDSEQKKYLEEKKRVESLLLEPDDEMDDEGGGRVGRSPSPEGLRGQKVGGKLQVRTTTSDDNNDFLSVNDEQQGPDSLGNTTLTSPAASAHPSLTREFTGTTGAIHPIEEEEDLNDEDGVTAGDGESTSIQSLHIRRIWGSWQTVHPASQGLESQTTYFQKSSYDVSRDHPAAFALRNEEGDDFLGDDDVEDDEATDARSEQSISTDEEMEREEEQENIAELQEQQQLMERAKTAETVNLSTSRSHLSTHRSTRKEREMEAASLLEAEKQETLQLRKKGMGLLLHKTQATPSNIDTGKTNDSGAAGGNGDGGGGNGGNDAGVGGDGGGSPVPHHSKKKGKKKSKTPKTPKKPKNPFYISEDSIELAQQDPMKIRGKIILLKVKEPMTLFSLSDTMIQARQSRSHYFTIPDVEHMRVIEFTVSILFQGNFTTHGYKLGRIAASLFRLPATEDGERGGKGKSDNNNSVTSASSLPLPIGYTPYDCCSPNLPNSMGRIIIFHKPKEVPISPGTFQIVIGSASTSKYSIEVIARYATAALPVIDEEYLKAKAYQSRLPTCLSELESIVESVILAERKLLICEKLIQEAELETNRTSNGIKLIRDKLMKDDEELFLLEDERRDLLREVNILEVEYGQWSKILLSRSQEKQDIRDGISQMYSFQRDREKEKANIQSSLEIYRRDLPACIRILRNMPEAVNVAHTLNTIITGVAEEEGAAALGDWGGIKLSTPAEDIRRAVKQYGFDSLILEEQQWCLLDQSLNPSKYEWLRELEEKEKQERAILGKIPKDRKRNPQLEPYRLNKSEIGYILSTPFSMLTRREVTIRKLLTKYHDDVEVMKRSISAVGLSFDPHLAEKTRAKHPKSYSKEEKEWSTIDQILHPEVSYLLCCCLAFSLRLWFCFSCVGVYLCYSLSCLLFFVDLEVLCSS
jgi:hypothetical protein